MKRLCLFCHTRKTTMFVVEAIAPHRWDISPCCKTCSTNLPSGNFSGYGDADFAASQAVFLTTPDEREEVRTSLRAYLGK